MFPLQIDFYKISQALSISLETAKQAGGIPHSSLEQIELAQKQLWDALSYNLSRAF
jgi:hypothetical protein